MVAGSAIQPSLTRISATSFGIICECHIIQTDWVKMQITGLRFSTMPLTRSQNMARIKSVNTKPERLLRKALWGEGMRYRINHKIEKIRPDLVFPGPKLVVFVDGCQWHGCPEHYVRPRSNAEFWQSKLLENVNRDTRQTILLTEKGWRVYRVWEHQIWENLPEVTSIIKTLVKGLLFSLPESWRVFQVDVIDPEIDMERRHMRLLTAPESVQIIERQRTTKKWSRHKI